MQLLFPKMQTLAVALLCYCAGYGQIAIGTTTPDPNAILTISSTTQGVLPPRLTTAQQATLAGVLTSIETGMLIVDATSGDLLGWNGTVFVPAGNLTAVTPLSVSATNQVSLNAGTASGQLITWDGANWVSMAPAVQHFSFTDDNRQPWLAVNFCIALEGIFPSRSDAEPFVSQIELFAFNFTPTGWAACNGQLLSISSNTALFSLVGTYYGGNGTSTFGLPDLRGRAALGMGQGPGLSLFNPGQTGGTESTTISH
jgi:microcystin-dependent protein